MAQSPIELERLAKERQKMAERVQQEMNDKQAKLNDAKARIQAAEKQRAAAELERSRIEDHPRSPDRLRHDVARLYKEANAHYTEAQQLQQRMDAGR